LNTPKLNTDFSTHQSPAESTSEKKNHNAERGCTIKEARNRKGGGGGDLIESSMNTQKMLKIVIRTLDRCIQQPHVTRTCPPSMEAILSKDVPLI